MPPSLSISIFAGLKNSGEFARTVAYTLGSGNVNKKSGTGSAARPAAAEKVMRRAARVGQVSMVGIYGRCYRRLSAFGQFACFAQAARRQHRKKETD